jgi:sphingomyelin phosphodiesterase
MDLNEANQNNNPRWYKVYSAKQAYELTSLLPKDWNNFINRMVQDKYLFEKYHRYIFSILNFDCS